MRVAADDNHDRMGPAVVPGQNKENGPAASPETGKLPAPEGFARNQAVILTATGFAAGSGDRNAASSTASRILAVFKCASLTCP